MRMRTLISSVAVASAVAGLALSVPGSAQAAGHRTPWQVTIKADKTTMQLGKKVWFTGKVNKSAAGKLVRLYERTQSGKKWRFQRNALVHKNGHYTTWDKPTANTRRSYRVVMPRTKQHQRGVSEKVIVDVYRWTSLTNLPSVNRVGFDSVASVSMNAVSFPSSLEAHIYHYPNAPTSQSVEFNLGHKCTRFRGTFGLSDDSQSGSGATVTASADGTTWFDHTYSLGESDHNAFTFATPPLKVRFDSASQVDGLDGQGAVGSPQVLCEQ